MARGWQSESGKTIPAMEMTKWFNTNYHYIVPEIGPDTDFSLNPDKIVEAYKSAKNLGIETRPVLIGPITYLSLSKSTEDGFVPIGKLESLSDVFLELLVLLKKLGVQWIQLDEPFLALDLSPEQRKGYLHLFEKIRALKDRPNILLASYFADISINSDLVEKSPCEGLHLDLAAGNNLDGISKLITNKTTVSLGLINGRNIWRDDLSQAKKTAELVIKEFPEKDFIISSSCSMLHLPVDVDLEVDLNESIKPWLAFAEQKLDFIATLRDSLNSVPDVELKFQENQKIIRSRTESGLVHNLPDSPPISELDDSLFSRKSSFNRRKLVQADKFGLPAFPTTTIGSFPQTREVRRMRAKFRKGEILPDDYEQFLREETKRTIEFQENIGLDVLVHGEFERNDMVQYFGEKLSGFAFTKYGWVQSYGSRYVRPPIIYGDVSRPEPMTVKWSKFAQSLSEQPVKGMLTGPVTILQWSFVRDDQPRSETCKQIAFAIREEVLDLEKAGIGIIQIDEPALREGLPLQRKDWDAYLDWAVKCFRIAASGVEDETQIHTHMCYAEFNDIISAISDMDADVISIEASRSKMELLDAFGEVTYPNEIGPGVYDIHSPNIPSTEEMVNLLREALNVISHEQLWVNPDCGLKTRGWEEVKPSLSNMVTAAKKLRAETRA